MAGEIFISYRRADEAWARLLHEQLQAEGVEAWYDAQVGAGQDWRAATAQALEASRIFVLLFSSNAAQSSDIAKELGAAVLEKKLIVPVRLENIAPKGAFLYELASRNWINAYDQPEAKLAQLAKGLARLVKTGARDESVLPFERDRPPARRRKWLVPALIAAAAALLIAGAAAALLWPHPRPMAAAARPAAVRVTVKPFTTLGDDPGLRPFAGGLQAEISGELNQNQIPVNSRQEGAAYAFGGTVERSGRTLLVRARLDDARQGVTVWSSEFSGDAATPVLLQKEIAAIASQVAQSAVQFDALAKGDTDAMTLLIKSTAYSTANRGQDREAEWDNMRKLVAKFPNSPYFQGDFAVISAFLAAESEPGRAAELRGIAKMRATRALALDRKQALAYFAQALIFSSVGHWSEREKFLLEGLAADPRNPLLTNIESNLLREVGRLKDAVDYGRQTHAVPPASPNRDATLLLAFAAAGNNFEGDALADSVGKSWPLYSPIWNARMQEAIFNARWDGALALLAPGGYVPLPEPAAQAWRSALTAARSGNEAAKRAAIRQLAAQLAPAALWTAPLPNESMSPGSTVGLIAMLGDKDTAFAQARAYLKRDTYADSSFLFWPGLAEFRRDARFMPLAADIGLTDYWRASGKWPDFCAEPGLPYNCRTEAKRLSR